MPLLSWTPRLNAAFQEIHGDVPSWRWGAMHDGQDLDVVIVQKKDTTFVTLRSGAKCKYTKFEGCYDSDFVLNHLELMYIFTPLEHFVMSVQAGVQE